MFDLVASILKFYFALVIPYRLALIGRIPNDFIVHEFLFDMILLLDAILSFFTAYYKDLNIVVSYSLIAKNNIKKFVYLDIIASFPYYLSGPHLYWLKIPRVFRVFKMFPSILALFTFQIGSKEKAAEWHKFMVTLKVLRFATTLMIICHSMACI